MSIRVTIKFIKPENVGKKVLERKNVCLRGVQMNYEE